MERSNLRRRLSVAAFCLCPLIWLFGLAALCHCPGIWATAGVIALVPTILGATRLHQLIGVLFLIFSVTRAVEEHKAYAHQQAVVEQARRIAAERFTAAPTTPPPTTQP